MSMSMWSKIWDIPYYHELIDGDRVMTNKEAYGIIFSKPRRSGRNFMMELFKALDKSNKQNTMPPIPTPQRVPVGLTTTGFTTTLSPIKMDITTEALIKIELASIPEEYRRPRASTHEGYACLLEEVNELWDEVKNNGSKERLRAEAVQVAAMAVRFIQELTNTDEEIINDYFNNIKEKAFVFKFPPERPNYIVGFDPYYADLDLTPEEVRAIKISRFDKEVQKLRNVFFTGPNQFDTWRRDAFNSSVESLKKKYAL
jgi:hypothetical protein